MKAYKVISPDRQLWYGTFKTEKEAKDHMKKEYPNDPHEIIEVSGYPEQERKEAHNAAIDKAIDLAYNSGLGYFAVEIGKLKI